MKTFASLLCCPALLAACAMPAPPAEPRWPGQAGGARYDFNWQLSGDREVAPMQVFHDGRDTWMHFAPGQPVPALFVASDQGERLVQHTRRDPYVVVRGIWPAVIMRGGRSQAAAHYLGGDAASAGVAPAARALPVSATASHPLAAGIASAVVYPGAATAGAPAETAPGVPAPGVFQASPADGTMRALLRDWSRQAGWTFESEHWAVDVDIPLSGSASFASSFPEAVRSLLQASEMGERPVQPCFYANRVLRVVPLSEPCDRSAEAAKGTS